MRTPEAKINVWLDNEGFIHAEAPDGTQIELQQDDPSLTKIRGLLEAQRDKTRAEEEKRAQRKIFWETRSFDCPLTEVRCIKGECSKYFCVQQQRDQHLASHRDDSKKTPRGVKVRPLNEKALRRLRREALEKVLASDIEI